MGSAIIPTLRYRDAPAMLEWLCRTFDFQRHMVIEAGPDQIAHAQLTCGTGMIMLGSHRNDEFGQLQTLPAMIGATTQSAYIIVPDADAIYIKAKAAGARIVSEICDQDYGGRGFSCLDPEGHLWNFGTYDPWQGHDGSGS